MWEANPVSSRRDGAGPVGGVERGGRGSRELLLVPAAGWVFEFRVTKGPGACGTVCSLWF